MEAGFELLEHIDITAETSPTLDLFHQLYTDHVLPAADLITHYVNSLSRVDRLILKAVFASQKRRLGKVRSSVERRTDVDYFVRHSSYDRFLLRRRAGEA